MADSRLYVSAGEKRLAASISATATTIQLTDINGRDGTALVMADFGTLGFATLEPKSSGKIELISFTGISSTSLTGVTRGLKFEADYTADTALRKTHSAGATMIFSNSPQMYDNFANKGNDETVTGVWTFTDPTGRPKLTADVDTAVDEEFVSFGQLARQAIAGAADASAAVAGLAEIATSSESQAGTDTGSVAELFVAPSDIAANTQNQQHVYAADTGAADAYAITLAPAVTAYAAGQRFCFLATNLNTGASTLNVNALGVKTILKNNDKALEAGDIEAGQLVDVIYNGTAFEMQTPTGLALTSAQASEIAAIVDATDVSGAELETLTDGSNADTLHTHSLSTLQSLQNASTTITRPLILRIIEEGGGISATSPMGQTLTGTAAVVNLPASIRLSDGIDDKAAVWSSNGQVGAGSAAKGPLDEGLTMDEAFTFEWLVRFASGDGHDDWSGLDAETAGTFPTTGVNMGFFKDAAVVYAQTADGATATQTDVTASFTLDQWNSVKIERGASSVLFYINNTLVATHTTNLPGSGSAAFHTIIQDLGTGTDHYLFIGTTAQLTTTRTFV